MQAPEIPEGVTLWSELSTDFHPPRVRMEYYDKDTERVWGVGTYLSVYDLNHPLSTMSTTMRDLARQLSFASGSDILYGFYWNSENW